MLKEKEIVDLVPDTFEKEGGVLLRITRCIVGHPTKVETYNTDGFRASLTDAEIAFWTNAHLGQHNAKPEQSIEEVGLMVNKCW